MTEEVKVHGRMSLRELLPLLVETDAGNHLQHPCWLQQVSGVLTIDNRGCQ